MEEPTDNTLSYPNGLRGELQDDHAVLFELEVNENLRAGYLSIGGTSYTQAAVSHLVCSPGQLNTYTYILPETIPTRGGFLLSDGGGTLSWTPVRKRFFNRVEVSSVHEHYFTGTVTSGRCTFYLTSNGLSTGTALFVQIYNISPSIVCNVSNVVETAYTSTNSVSTDLKTVQINCVYRPSTSLNNVVAVPNGTSVSLRVTGKPVGG